MTIKNWLIITCRNTRTAATDTTSLNETLVERHHLPWSWPPLFWSHTSIWDVPQARLGDTTYKNHQETNSGIRIFLYMYTNMFFWEWFLVLEPFIIHSMIGMDWIHRSHEFLGRSDIHGTWMEVRSCMYRWLWKWVEWVGTSEPARSVMEWLGLVSVSQQVPSSSSSSSSSSCHLSLPGTPFST